jgi:phosphatidylserine/phosphatidylglycerophosphate/cardiolipin synthase-like enzyme
LVIPQNKYIGTKETARLTGLSMQEIYDLIHKGTLVAHKAPKSGWRIPFQVFKLMAEVKHSLKIATANLRNFNVFVESEDGQESLRLCDFFLSLVERGVHVQLVCMKPFGFYLYTKENCPQLLENQLFELRYNGRNHMKIFIFDDECAYFGSANITEAAIGKRASGHRNHEAGLLVWGSMIQAPLRHFEKSWNDPDILKHTWKRFATMAKELKERYGE